MFLYWAWSHQPYPELLNLPVERPLPLPLRKEILISPKSIVHSLMVENLLKLGACLVSGKPFCVKIFQKILLTLSQIIDEKAHFLVMSQRRENVLVSVLNEKIDPFQTPVKDNIEYLTFFFNYGNDYRTVNLHRSAISAFHEYVDALSVEKCPRICSMVSVVLKVSEYLFFDIKKYSFFDMKLWNNHIWIYISNFMIFSLEITKTWRF